jgi:hypothetical protein
MKISNFKPTERRLPSVFILVRVIFDNNNYDFYDFVICVQVYLFPETFMIV